MKVGYYRIARDGEHSRAYAEALIAAGCSAVFADTGPAKSKRLELARAAGEVKRGDELIVWTLASLGRTIVDTVNLVLELERRGVRLQSVTEGFDSGGAAGREIVAFLATISVRELKRKLNAEQLAQARRWIAAKEMTREEVAEVLGVHVNTLSKRLAETEGQDGGKPLPRRVERLGNKMKRKLSVLKLSAEERDRKRRTNPRTRRTVRRKLSDERDGIERS